MGVRGKFLRARSWGAVGVRGCWGLGSYVQAVGGILAFVHFSEESAYKRGWCAWTVKRGALELVNE